LPQGSKCEEVRGLLAGAECKGGTTGSGSGTVLVPGPLVVDLMTGTTTPDLSGLRLPAGNYKRIDFRLDEAKAGEVPATEPLEGLPVATCLSKGDISITHNVLRIDDQAKGDCSGAEELVKTNVKRSGDLRKSKD
jgi:hypothetical protein